MQRFKSILFVPLANRGNPAAIRRVTELARGSGAKLTLFGVAGEPTRLQRLFDRDGLVEDAVLAERARMDKLLQRWAARESTDADVDVEVGDVALRIIERVLAGSHDLVVVTSDEDSEDQASIRRLLRKCPCPVWVIRPTRARTQRVLAAVNPDPDEAELNRTILELAASMVHLHGGELHVVHAWALYGESALRSSGFMHVDTAELSTLLEQERGRHETALQDLLMSSPLAHEPWQVHLLKGPAAQVVPALVAKRSINVLVMGTVARTGVSAMVMGNTAERVLDAVHCSVIAIKPPGFVSPIRPRSA